MIGQSISHYRILEKLGEGGMGVVYKAQDTSLDRTVALKFLPRTVSGSEEERQRFIHEAKAVSALDHPNICTVYEINETSDGELYIAMAYYGGMTLSRKIAGGALKTEDALRIAIQVAEGLQAAHEKQIIHRDIKSGNIILTEGGQAKVLDFGLARKQDRTKLTRTGSTLGTAAYMSPEQAKGEGADHRSDLWSLGVVLYEMLTGKLPFRGAHEAAMMYAIVNEEPQPIEQQIQDASPELIHIIQRALEKDASERYQSAVDMLIDLRRLKKETSRTGYQPVRLKQARWGRRKLFVASGIAVVAAVCLVAVLWPRGPRLNPNRSERVLNLPFPGVGLPCLSSDGKRMIIDCDAGDGRRRIHEVNIRDGSYRRVTEEATDGGIALSPDGTQIAFGSMRNVRVISTLGGASRLVAELAVQPFWRSDGKRMGYRKLHRPFLLEYRSVRPDGSDDKREFVDSLSSVFFMHERAVWSPDGRSIAYIHTFPEGFNEVFIYESERNVSRQVTHDRSVVDELAWDRNNMIVYSSAKSGIMQLWSIPAVGGKTEQITSGEGWHSAHALSADGKTLVYHASRSEGELWIAKLDNGICERLPLSSSVRVQPAMSPDGSKIVVSQVVGDGSPFAALTMIDRVRGSSEQLLPPDKYYCCPSWSPDGKRIAFGMLPVSRYGAEFVNRQLMLLSDSALCCVLSVDDPGKYRVVGRGIPGQWLDRNRFLARRANLVQQPEIQYPYVLQAEDSSSIPRTAAPTWFLTDVEGSPQTLYAVDSPGRVTTPSELDVKKVHINEGASPGRSWELVTVRETGEKYFFNRRTEKKKLLPGTIQAHLREVAGLYDAILSWDERELIMAKQRTTSKLIVIDNVFE